MGTSWAMLLAHWTSFARAATRLPDTGDAGRVKRVAPALIGLQAVACALGEIGRLGADERAAALALSAVMIRRHAAELSTEWDGERLPAGVSAFVDDAMEAWVAAGGGRAGGAGGQGEVAV